MTEITEAELARPHPPVGTNPAAPDGGGLLANSSALLASRLVVAALGWAGNGGGVASGRGSVANGHPLAEQALALHRSRRRD